MKLITIIPKRYTETLPANALSKRPVGIKQHTVGTTYNQAAWPVKNLQTFGKKRHHEPPYIKAAISAAQKISKQFTK